MNQFNKRTLDRQKFMLPEEIGKLKRAIENLAIADLAKGRTTYPRVWMVIDLATGSGLRVSELTQLRIGHLTLNTKDPRIQVTGKGGRTREVFISRDLTRHLNDFLKWKRTIEEPTGQDDFLLLSSHGKPFSTRTLQYAFKSALKIANLPTYYSFHACRHSYATMLYRKSRNLRLTQKQLGHSSITTTTIYADVLLDETLDAVNGLFEENKPPPKKK